MPITPPLIVSAPEPRGLRYGLFAAANGPLDLPPHGIAGGLAYKPVSCGRARLYPVECPAGQTPTPKVFDLDDPLVTAEPFVVYASLVCGAAGTNTTQLEAAVRRRLANGEQTSAEQGLAGVLAGAATPLGVFADGDDIRDVIGGLEQWLYGADGVAYGNVGYLHLPTRFAGYAGSHGLILKDGQVWRTHLGTIVVFGGGYPDTGAVYISGQVTLWRDPEVIVPPLGQTFDRVTNQYNALAERTYAVGYDCVAAWARFLPGAAS